MRVLQVLGNSAGGIARHVATIASELGDDDRFDIAVAAPGELPVSIDRREIDLEIPDGPLGHRAVIARLRDHITKRGYEVVHAHGLRAGIDSGRAARHSGAHRVVTVHNLVRPEVAGKVKAPLYRAAEPLCLSSVDHVFCVSRDIASTLGALKIPRPPVIEVLHLGAGPAPGIDVDKEAVRSSLEVPDGDALIVTVARLSPQKALHVLLEAVASLRRPSVLAILGEGPLETELKQLASDLGVADRVRWLGFRDDVSDHISAADIFCLSSIWEGIPLAAMEAMALDTPVVATAVGGMDELIANGVSGRLVPPDDPRALCVALEEVLEEPLAAAGLAERARKVLSVNFSTERMLEKLASHYLAAVNVG